MKKLYIVIIFLLILFLNGCTQVDNKSNDDSTNINKLPTRNCAEKGEVIDSCTDCAYRCCSGLKPLDKFVIDGECENFIPDRARIVCSDCGNGVCESRFAENSCNCPEDCS